MKMPVMIQRLLEVTHWSQADLAEEVGVSQGDISKYLKGREPRDSTAEAIRTLARKHGVLNDQAESTAQVDTRAQLAEIFADLVKADEKVQRLALKVLRSAVYGPGKSGAIKRKGGSS